MSKAPKKKDKKGGKKLRNLNQLVELLSRNVKKETLIAAIEAAAAAAIEQLKAPQEAETATPAAEPKIKKKTKKKAKGKAKTETAAIAAPEDGTDSHE